MECNKDEALRAQSIAEEKLKRKDFNGAKKFALKAQNLFSDLKGISGMLTTIDVYSSSQKKLNEEIDWYAVLNVNESDNDDTIKKQYRKLALLVHPDKNKCFGAEDAFKLVGEAWALLSDKAQRLAYNQRTNGFRFTASNAFPPTPPRASGFPSYPSYTNASNTYPPFRPSGFPSHTNAPRVPRPTPASYGFPSYASHTNPVPNARPAPNHTQLTPPSAQTSKEPPEPTPTGPPTPSKESGPHGTMPVPNTPNSNEILSTSSIPIPPSRRNQTRAANQSGPPKERVTRTYTKRKKPSVPNTESPSTPIPTPPTKRTRTSASGPSVSPKECVTRTYTRKKKSSAPNTEIPSMEATKGEGIQDWERDEDDYKLKIAILKAHEDLKYIYVSAGEYLKFGASFEAEREKERKLEEERSHGTSCSVV